MGEFSIWPLPIKSQRVSHRELRLDPPAITHDGRSVRVDGQILSTLAKAKLAIAILHGAGLIRLDQVKIRGRSQNRATFGHIRHAALPTGTSNIYDEAISFMAIATQFIEKKIV